MNFVHPIAYICCCETSPPVSLVSHSAASCAPSVPPLTNARVLMHDIYLTEDSGMLYGWCTLGSAHIAPQYDVQCFRGHVRWNLPVRICRCNTMLYSVKYHRQVICEIANRAIIDPASSQPTLPHHFYKLGDSRPGTERIAHICTPSQHPWLKNRTHLLLGVHKVVVIVNSRHRSLGRHFRKPCPHQPVPRIVS